jgi:hypothetical protein
MTSPASQFVPLALATGLVLAGVVVSLLTLSRAQALLRAAKRTAGEPTPSAESAIGVLQQQVEALQTRVDETRQYAAVTVASPAPRSGLNLDKRSQALRLHRRGEAPQRIAAMLELPRQEVELLLKVHRIVLRSI